MLNVGCGRGLWGRGVVYREMSEVVQETEQEDWNREMRQETEQEDWNREMRQETEQEDWNREMRQETEQGIGTEK